ncbi:DUF3343 domain-containing protein [Endozoicomonas sp. SESOKO1]|uniref:DUF3343 domain-containing protein n=1 Tax=Endozoicomonas sp. SESOKO1 TaxID=2828742 RepID=UPI002147CF06|nr:DUF3343 domain-containing protein [Endozoicomonas sp. SESOKO1]
MKRSFLLLPSMRLAIKAEAFCRDSNIACEVVPVPRQISSECGMCLEVDNGLAEQVQRQLEQAGLAAILANTE